MGELVLAGGHAHAGTWGGRGAESVAWLPGTFPPSARAGRAPGSRASSTVLRSARLVGMKSSSKSIGGSDPEEILLPSPKRYLKMSGDAVG